MSDNDWDSGDSSRSPPRVLFGQFARADKSEYICSVTNVSIDGAAFKSRVLAASNEFLVAKLEHLGRVECRAGEATGDGFMVRWDISPADRTAFLSKFTWLDDYYAGKAADSRQYNRRQFSETKSVVTLLDGRSIPCEISDISLSGAGVIMKKVPDIGSKIYLGKVLCEVMRHTDEGLGVRFLTGFGSDLMSELLAGENI
ncbi:PilZ domain-containing protein [Aestuariivirga sp.]|uniref:PilZ domain-containing protein n=1 Tax=Aestuariivirga sp. TaxID=2650926 RepID=UPI0035942260